MHYVEIPDFDEKVKAVLESNDPREVQIALLSTVMRGDNYDFSVSTTTRFINHNNEYVLGSAIECISHIARIWGKLPHEFIEAAENALNDPSGWVKDKADFTIDDIEVFIKGYERPSV